MRRVRRPPTDPVNAVLSLLYTFLYNQVYSAIRQAHLDPYLGHLHSLDYGRYSLVLDLMEEFRPVIVDSLVFTLFNMRILSIVRLGFCMNNFLVLLTLRVRLTGLHS